jgi:cell wall-associated NlpC family hydrolase
MELRLFAALMLLALMQPACAEPDAGSRAAAAAAAAASMSLITATAMTAATTPAAAAVGDPEPTQPETIESQSLRVVDWAASRTQDLIATSLSLLGVKYRRGASDPSVGFDCSGFVRHVYKEAVGLLLPHSAYSMSLQGKSVGLDDLKPGDLVFFNTLKRQFSHVGIYLGDNRFIHAPSHGKSVQVDTLTDSYWVRHFTGARRIDTAAAASTPRE